MDSASAHLTKTSPPDLPLSPEAPPGLRPSDETYRHRLGRMGEEHVAQWLEDHGIRILARNWRGRAGEADIIGDDGLRLRLVEVKTRRGTGFGHPLEAITPEKYQRLWRLGLEYRGSCALHRTLVVDAAAVLYQRGRFRLEYLPDVRP